MARVYRWTDDEDEVAMDAVTVEIGTDTRILKIAGLEFGELSAWVYWPEWKHKGELIPAQSEGPLKVPAALVRADEMARRYGFNDVVIVLQDHSMWNAAWGTLAAKSGVR
jgi:hypothetical protein